MEDKCAHTRFNYVFEMSQMTIRVGRSTKGKFQLFNATIEILVVGRRAFLGQRDRKGTPDRSKTKS